MGHSGGFLSVKHHAFSRFPQLHYWQLRFVWLSCEAVNLPVKAADGSDNMWTEFREAQLSQDALGKKPSKRLRT